MFRRKTLSVLVLVVEKETPKKTIAKRGANILRAFTALFSVTLPLAVNRAAEHVTVGVNGDAARGIAVLLLTPALLAFTGGVFRLFAHYKPDVAASKELDGCGKYLALAASVIVVAQGAAVVFPL